MHSCNCDNFDSTVASCKSFKRNFIIVEINYIIIHYISNNRVNSLKSLTKCNSCCQYVKYHIVSESESTAPAAIFFFYDLGVDLLFYV